MFMAALLLTAPTQEKNPGIYQQREELDYRHTMAYFTAIQKNLLTIAHKERHIGERKTLDAKEPTTCAFIYEKAKSRQN